METKTTFLVSCCFLLTTSCIQASSIGARNVNDTSSCVGRCGAALLPGAPCQCNSACERFQDCCDDYYKCGSGTVGLEALAEELLALDVNNVAHLVQVDTNLATPLLKVDPSVYNRLTIAKLVQLHDNYFPEIEFPEIVTPEEIAENNEFFDAIFETRVLKRAQEFLSANGYQSDREYLTNLWFGIYNRGGKPNCSSGFEHVFLGELWNGISGFHNWLYYAREEANGNASTISVAKLMNFYKGWVIENSMSWHGTSKPIGGGFIGTSPEFEFAIYSVCWIMRPDALCPISLNGHRLNIQSYKTVESHSPDATYISTAYTVIS